MTRSQLHGIDRLFWRYSQC